jgi:hypothetical protein
MADITAEAAAKRPFDEHRLAVLMLRIFWLELRAQIREMLTIQVLPPYCACASTSGAPIAAVVPLR